MTDRQTDRQTSAPFHDMATHSGPHNKYEMTVNGLMLLNEMGTLKPQSNGPFYSNAVIGTLAVDGWAVTFGMCEEGPGRAGAPPNPLLAVPNVTAQPSTANVPTSYYWKWHLCILEG